jgi:hypothetical protein
MWGTTPHPGDPRAHVTYAFGSGVLDIRVQIEDRSYSEHIFSEGYQDLLTMLFFLVTARVTAAHGRVQVLILDDVLQSVDAHIRVALMQFILRDSRIGNCLSLCMIGYGASSYTSSFRMLACRSYRSNCATGPSVPGRVSISPPATRVPRSAP